MRSVLAPKRWAFRRASSNAMRSSFVSLNLIACACWAICLVGRPDADSGEARGEFGVGAFLPGELAPGHLLER